MGGVPEIAMLVLLVVASATDLLYGKIYNGLTFSFFIVGLIYKTWVSGLDGLTDGLLAVAMASALFIPLYAMRVVAAGDAKLLMAMGAWTNAKTVLEVAALAIIAGAIVGVVSMLRQKGLRGSAQSVAENIRTARPTAGATKMPFAPAFFCAYLFVSVAHYRHWEIL